MNVNVSGLLLSLVPDTFDEGRDIVKWFVGFQHADVEATLPEQNFLYVPSRFVEK